MPSIFLPPLFMSIYFIASETAAAAIDSDNENRRRPPSPLLLASNIRFF